MTILNAHAIPKIVTMLCSHRPNCLVNTAPANKFKPMNKSIKLLLATTLIISYALTTGCGDDNTPQADASEHKVLSLAGDDAAAADTEQQPPAPRKDNPTLKLVPADTFAFVGNTESVSVTQMVDDMQPFLSEMLTKYIAINREMFQSVGSANSESGSETNATTNSEQGDSDTDPNNNSSPGEATNEFMLSYLNGYLEFAKDPGEFLDRFGIDADAVNYAFYTAGVTPVFRIEINDSDKFSSAVDSLVDESEYVRQINSEDGSTALQKFLIEIPEDDVSITTSVEVIDNIASIALSFTKEQNALNPFQLAENQQSIADSGVLASVSDKYDYDPRGFGFIDFQQLATMVVDPASESGSRFLASLDAENASKLKTYQTPACQAEFKRLAEIWPRATMGYKTLGKSGDRYNVESHFALELNQPEIASALALLRGHIPESIMESDGLASFALGVDAGNLAEALNVFVSLLSNVDYQCPPLSGMNQKSITGMQTGVGQLAMFSAFVDGVRGIGFTVFDNGDERYNGLATIAATDTGKLLNMAKMFPQLADVVIPEDGTAINIAHKLDGLVDANVPLSLNDLSIAQRNNQILVFSGAQATTLAETTSGQIDQSNGFLYASGTEALFQSAVAGIAASRSSFDDEKMMAAGIKNIEDMASIYPNMYYNYRVDFTDHGIEVDVDYDFDTRSYDQQ